MDFSLEKLKENLESATEGMSSEHIEGLADEFTTAESARMPVQAALYLS